MVQPTFIPHGRDQLEVFLVENEMHSPGARVGVGDALLIKGVSQGFRSTEEDSYSGTFGKKQKEKDSFRLWDGINYKAHGEISY